MTRAASGSRRPPPPHSRPSSTRSRSASRTGPGACKDILEAPQDRGPNRQAVQDLIDGLPDGLDPDVREALQESFDNLWSLVESKSEDLKADEPAQTETTEQETTTTETQDRDDRNDSSAHRNRAHHPGGTPLPPDGDGENGGAVSPDGNGGEVGPGATKEKKEKGK